MMKKLLSIYLMFVLCRIGFAQGKDIMTLVNHADSFNQILPQETVYLHFDNTGYFKGETIWFSAYVMSSKDNTFTSKSNVLYVELVDPLGVIVDNRIIKLINGQGSGEFYIMQHLATGFYEIRAYTRYMLNFDDECVFSRVLPIFESPENIGDYSHPTINKMDETAQSASQRKDRKKYDKINVDFYPEGGNSIIGKTSRVAFNIYSNKRLHISAECFLIECNDTIANVMSNDMGRGVFTYIPKDEKYTFIVRYDNKDYTIPLMAPLNSGCSLKVDVSDKDVSITASPTENLMGYKLGVIASHHGNVEYCDSFIVDGGEYSKKIETKSLKEGVNTITVFSTSGAILAERRFFIYPAKSLLPIDIELSSKEVLPYGEIDIMAHSIPNANFSIAVCDADNMIQGKATDISTDLLLSSDLRGYVEHASYYLESDDEEHRKATDLLMLVQGWRKYDFSVMNGLNKPDLKQPAENKRLIKGRLYPNKKKGNVGNVDMDVVLYNAGSDNIMGSFKTDEKGYYTFEVPDCYGTWDMVMKTSVEGKGKNCIVGLDRNISPEPKVYDYYEQIQLPVDTPQISFNVDNRKWISSQMKDIIALYGVDVIGKKKDVSWNSEIIGAYKANIKYDMDKIAELYEDEGKRSPSLVECLKQLNPHFSGGDNISGVIPFKNIKFNYYDNGPAYDNKPILWFLDNNFMFATNMPAKNVSTPTKSAYENLSVYLFPASIDDIKSVYISTDNSVVRRFTISHGIDGLNYVTVHVYSYNKLGTKHEGLRRTHFEGFNQPKVFESNDYSYMMKEPDFRRTLYWNPQIQTDKNGDAHIKFYNSSFCKNITISSEGVSDSGEILIYK